MSLPLSVTADMAKTRLREWLEAPYPETVQIEGDVTVVTDVLAFVLGFAKAKGFLAGRVDLAEMVRSLGPQPRSRGLDDMYQEWALKGAANTKMVDRLSTERASSRARALMIVNALGYSGPEHMADIKGRIRALNNQLDELDLWILFACDPTTPEDSVASHLATGRMRVAGQEAA